MLLHGLAERRQVFSWLAPLLAPHLRLVAIDLPGFGASPPLPGGGFDLGAVCERVEAVIAELGLERPAMLGHSLGGGVAVRYAAERPGALRALALIAPAGLIATGAVRPSWRRPRLHALGRGALRAATPLIAARRGLRERAFARVVGDPSALDRALARELLMGAAQGRSTPAAGIEIVYAGPARPARRADAAGARRLGRARPRRLAALRGAAARRAARRAAAAAAGCRARADVRAAGRGRGGRAGAAPKRLRAARLG